MSLVELIGAKVQGKDGEVDVATVAAESDVVGECCRGGCLVLEWTDFFMLDAFLHRESKKALKFLLYCKV